MKSIQPLFQISYSHDDRKAVEAIRRLLDKYGIEYFIDERDIKPSENILERIRDGIKNCTHLLVYLSPKSVESQWVIAEVGMALALDKKIIAILDHPSLKIPPFLSNRKYIAKMKDFEMYLSQMRNSFLILPSMKMTQVERLAKEHLYYGGGTFASAIRLFGADDEFITYGRLRVRYNHIPFEVPLEFLDERKRFLAKKELEAKEKNQLFFDGPNTRVLSWRTNPIDVKDEVTEQRVLELELGPVGWYDYEGLNNAFRDEIYNSGIERTYEYFIGLSALLKNKDFSKAKLSNLLDTATTIVMTCPHYLYQVLS